MLLQQQHQQHSPLSQASWGRHCFATPFAKKKKIKKVERSAWKQLYYDPQPRMLKTFIAENARNHKYIWNVQLQYSSVIGCFVKAKQPFQSPKLCMHQGSNWSLNFRNGQSSPLIFIFGSNMFFVFTRSSMFA